MTRSRTEKKSDFELTPAASEFISYFASLGLRWGLEANTCRIHALLYLASRPLSRNDIERICDLTKKQAMAAMEDLIQWKVVEEEEEGLRIVGGEPIDLMFSALEERGRREIVPALEVLRNCHNKAQKDDGAPPQVAKKISDMLKLVEDLSAIDVQSRRVASRPFSRLIGFGGRTARLINRAFPVSDRRK